MTIGKKRIIVTRKESGEGMQRILAEYTKKVMNRLYGKEVLVFFRDMSELRAIFRDEDISPYSVADYASWKKEPKCSITYCEGLYSPSELAAHAWLTLVHEVTHYAIGVKSDERRNIYHAKIFDDELATNLKKVDDLRKQFNTAVGWDENFVYEEDEEDEECDKQEEYNQWRNSVEGVLYNLSTIGDRLIDDDKDKILIAKTLLRLPEEIREKVLDEVLFVIMRASGTVENLRLSKIIMKGELKFKSFDKGAVSRLTIEQPLIILNFSEIKHGNETDTIAHEIAHFVLGHHINQDNPGNEMEADNLVERWGFKRAYRDYRQFTEGLREDLKGIDYAQNACQTKQ